MIGFPFDSHVTYDDDGSPVYDRAVSSAPYRAILKNVFSTGVLASDSCYKVTANGNMTVNVTAGFAMVEGLMKLDESATTLTIPAADANYDRIDTIVMRLDDNDSVRACELAVLQGTAADSPTAPELTREGSIYELGIANITVSAGATAITDDNITDTRSNGVRCGYIDSVNSMTELAELVKVHMADEVIHITAAERTKWNAGIVTDDQKTVIDSVATFSGDVSGRLNSITVSTTDITAGSELESGALYVVYEA